MINKITILIIELITNFKKPNLKGKNPKKKKFFKKIVWGQKVLEVSAHSISSPRPTPRRKKCPRTNEGNPDCQNVLPRTTLSSAGQNHRRGRHHVT